MSKFRYKTNQGTFVIDSNRQLTPEELKKAISGQIPSKREETITQERGGFKEAARRFVLGSELAQPIRSLFFEREREPGAERARAFVAGAGKTLGIPQAIRGVAGLKPEVEPVTKAKGFETAGRIAGVLPLAFAGGAGATRLLPKVGGLGGRLARGAVAGGITAGAISPEKELLDLRQRGVQAGAGAILGMVAEIVGAGISATRIRGTRAIRRFRMEPRAPITEQISKRISATKAARTTALQKAKTGAEKKILKSANRIDDELLNMTDDLQRSAETGTLEFQRRIPKAQRAASNEYGRRLDTISDDLVQRGKTITKGDMNEALTATKTEIRELQLPVGRAESVIDNLLETKYGTTQFSKKFTLKEVLKDTKLIKGQTSSGVRLGTKPFSDDELAAVIFNNNFGKVLEAKAPQLIELNKSYSPVIRVNKMAHKIFKPRAGELETKAGTQFLKRAATGKLERGERELLRILQEGTEFAPGIGEVAEPTKRIAERIAGRKIAGVKAKEAITKAGKIKEQRILQQFDKQLSNLAKRDDRVAQLLRNKAKADRIKRLVATGVIGGGLAITGIKKFFGILGGLSE